MARAGKVPSTTRSRSVKTAESVTDKAVEAARGLSPDPMTNALIADLALRGGGQLLRRAIERTVLGTRYSQDKARAIVKGRSMTQTLVRTALIRVATRSVPGAIVVAGGLLAKTLHDRRKGESAARAEGEKKIAKQAERGGDDG